jgi:two-component system sensor histidine kinase/response regulator
MAVAVAASDPVPEGISGGLGGSVPILVVDDNPSKRLAIRAILEPLGHTVFEAASGEEALRAVLGGPFAAILLDVKMPEMDGYETANLIRMRRACEHTPIIFITAHSQDEAEIPLAYASGAVDFIFAPLHPDILRAKVTIFADLYRQARELEAAHGAAVEASRAKSAFVANLSHEIRTPLNGVLGMAMLLRETELDATQRRYVEGLAASGDALLTVIGDVLDFSKIEAGSLDLDRTDFDLRELIHDACQILAERAHSKGLELSHFVTADVPAQVHGDRARLRQILLNLISNAVKFTSDGQVSVRLARVSPGEFHFAIADTGPGVDPEQAAALFEPFVQADPSTTREHGGTGLGLTISRQLVYLMGGAIGAEAGELGGSVFWFNAHLPEVPGDPATDRGEHQLGGLTALLIDDNPVTAGDIESYLDGWAIDHETVTQVADAIEAIERRAESGEPFEVVVLNVNLPLLSGMAFIDAMRERPMLGRSKLVVLSSLPIEPDLDDVPGSVVLMKPCRQSAIQDAIVAPPCVEPAGPQPDAPAEPQVDPVQAGGAPTVLAVDDDPINRVVITELLANLGVHADVAENGREAIEMAARTDYAAIFIDCQMPIVDGFEATEQIRIAEGPGRVPIIAVTALTMPEDRERCLQSGMDDYLSKPISSEDLSRMLMRWLPPEAVPQP